MPTLPWTPAQPAAPGADALVLGSMLELDHYRDVARFLVAAMKIRKQVHHSDGALGVSLIAQPARKTFWTLSAWRDQESLDAFVAALPHRDVMSRFHGRLKETRFETWTVATGGLPKPRSNAKELWTNAKNRLASVELRG